MTPDRADAALRRLDEDGVTVRLGEPVTRLHRDAYRELRDAVVSAVRRFHAESPLETVMPVPVLVQRLAWVDRPVVAALVQRLLGERILVGNEQAVSLADFKPVLTRAQQRLHDAIVNAFEAAGLTPPSLGDLSRELAVDEARLRPIVELCVDEGSLARLGHGLFLHRNPEADLRCRLESALQGSGGLTISEIKEVLGISRKYAVPICEHLDRVGFTRRIDDRRVLADA